MSKDRNPMRPTRRLFFGAAGAAVAAPLAVAAPAVAAPGGRSDLAARLSRLEAEKAIRALAELFVRRVNTGRRDDAAKLFVDPAKAAPDPKVRRLLPDTLGAPGTVKLAEDGAGAVLRAPYTVHTEAPMEGEGTLVDMLREAGEDGVRREERRTLELACVKRDGEWRIARAKLA